MIHVTFPDGASRAYEAGVSGLDIAKSISPSLAKRTVAMTVDGVLTDLADPIARWVEPPSGGQRREAPAPAAARGLGSGAGARGWRGRAARPRPRGEREAPLAFAKGSASVFRRRGDMIGWQQAMPGEIQVAWRASSCEVVRLVLLLIVGCRAEIVPCPVIEVDTRAAAV